MKEEIRTLNKNKDRFVRHYRSCAINNAGFTLMEIVVATTIFVVVSTSLMALFNYTLKINRRSEALRQASQGMRNFAEFLVKEVRNGQVDYYTSSLPIGSAPCRNSNGAGGDTYATQENKIGITTSDGYQECFYFADNAGTYVPLSSPNAFVAPAGAAYQLVMEKNGSPAIKENLVPANYRIENLKFIIRPVCDPYAKCSSYQTAGVNDYPRIQPSVSIFIKFVAQLSTGEQVPIFYQTSVSVNDYNIPSS